MFEYVIHFPTISLVKMTGNSHNYYKIRVDRLTKMKQQNKVVYKMVIFGIKEVLAVGDAHVQEAEIVEKLSDVDVLIPSFTAKMKYVGEDTTLFKESVWFMPSEIVP